MPTEANSRTFRLIQGGNEQGSGSDSTLSDLQIVAAVRDGNAAVAALFHDRLRPIVDRTLTRLIGGRDPDYDDLAQQALIELVLSVDRFRGECPLDAWASIIVARVVYKQIRRRRKERKLFALDRDELPEVVDRSGSVSMSMRSAVRRIEQHLRGMDANKAWTYVLHDVQGYNLDEVSTITGVSKAAAQSRLVRGRKGLHDRLARDPELAGMLRALSAKGET